MATVKTLKGWKGELDTYLKIGDLVDEDMVNYFLGVLPPETNTENMIQLGEPVRGETYSTLIKSEEGWKYVGVCLKGQTKHML